ncbi:hypothetical protein C0989_009456 [Termitomyces sp. Mn162]|nr:hypothetical protein C0989_009456 [Termitomyces sp. Mn162]
MNNDPTAWYARMLLHNNTTVPKWDESCPRKLPQYFKELEYLFVDCSIADNTQKKEYAAQYVSYNMVETWLGLLEFGDNITIGNNEPQPHTYQEWKVTVLRLYPGTDTSAHYNLGDLKQLVNQTFNSGLQGIPTLLWSKIVYWLKIMLPDHHPENPYDIHQVFKGA